MSADLLASLTTEIDRLWRSPQPRAPGLRQLARSILLDVSDKCIGDDVHGRRCGFEAFVTSCDAFQFARSQANADRNTVREDVLARNLFSASVLAWMAIHFTSVHALAEDLVLAALLADAGRVRPGRMPVAANDPKHVETAAALATGIDGGSVALTRLIRRHHERCDGTGFPAGLAADRLTIGDRLLSAASRFAELFETDLAIAAERLHNEARRGAFDAELTANLAWSITGTLTMDAGFGRPAPRPWSRTDKGRQRLRIDEAQIGTAEPHFSLLPRRTTQDIPFHRG